MDKKKWQGKGKFGSLSASRSELKLTQKDSALEQGG